MHKLFLKKIALDLFARICQFFFMLTIMTGSTLSEMALITSFLGGLFLISGGVTNSYNKIFLFEREVSLINTLLLALIVTTIGYTLSHVFQFSILVLTIFVFCAILLIIVDFGRNFFISKEKLIYIPMNDALRYSTQGISLLILHFFKDILFPDEISFSTLVLLSIFIGIIVSVIFIAALIFLKLEIVFDLKPRKLSKRSKYLVTYFLLISIIGQLDIIYLNNFYDNDALGLYGYAVRVNYLVFPFVTLFQNWYMSRLINDTDATSNTLIKIEFRQILFGYTATNFAGCLLLHITQPVYALDILPIQLFLTIAPFSGLYFASKISEVITRSSLQKAALISVFILILYALFCLFVSQYNVVMLLAVGNAIAFTLLNVLVANYGS